MESRKKPGQTLTITGPVAWGSSVLPTGRRGLGPAAVKRMQQRTFIHMSSSDVCSLNPL